MRLKRKIPMARFSALISTSFSSKLWNVNVDSLRRRLEALRRAGQVSADPSSCTRSRQAR